jgi:hypothetical protein
MLDEVDIWPERLTTRLFSEEIRSDYDISKVFEKSLVIGSMNI